MSATKIDNLYVDAVVRLNHSAPLKVSSHAIETGEQVADHVVEEDEFVTLEVYFADDGLVTRSGLDMDARALLRVTSAADKRDEVFKIKKDRRLVSITTSDERWDNMLLTDIQRDITVKNRKGFEATLVFQKIKTQTTGTVSVPADRIAKKSVAKQTAAGKQTPTKEEGAKDAPVVTAEEKDKALLKAGLEALLG